jgi:hypothetical protein
MSVSARAQAKGELLLFAKGFALGVVFVVFTLFLFRGFLTGLFAFIWVASRIEYIMVGALVFDVILHQRVPGRPRYMPMTAFAGGLVLPVLLVWLSYAL